MPPPPIGNEVPASGWSVDHISLHAPAVAASSQDHHREVFLSDDFQQLISRAVQQLLVATYSQPSRGSSITSASPVHDDQDDLQDPVSPAPSYGSHPSLLVEVEPWDPDLYHCI